MSPSLVEAFQQDVAKALVPISPRRLVPLRPAAGAIATAFIAGGGLLAAAAWSPLLANGLRTLLRRPSLPPEEHRASSLRIYRSRAFARSLIFIS